MIKTKNLFFFFAKAVISIQDVNDNQPIFNQSRYFATIPENATVGTSVLQVFATDTDADDNGLVTYSINRRQSDKDQMFRIDSKTGLISVNKLLDFETKELHELVVVAKDNGEQPLETTAFVSIRVTDVSIFLNNYSRYHGQITCLQTYNYIVSYKLYGVLRHVYFNFLKLGCFANIF